MKTNVHTGWQHANGSRANAHQPVQRKAGAAPIDKRPTAVKQLVARTTIESSQRLVAQRQIAQRIAGGRNLASVAATAGPIIQRQVIDGSKSYSGKQIYRRYRDAFDDAGVTEDEIIEYVDETDDITKAELFQLFKVKTKRVIEDDPCDEELRVGKQKERTSAPARKHQKLYNTITFQCDEPTCFHTSRAITLHKDGTERGYANKHGRRQAPPVAHDKDAPANVRLGAFNEVVRAYLKAKGKGRTFESIKLNARFKGIRKRVEWTGKLGQHHQSHTTCNLRNKDITWTNLSKSKKSDMRKNVRAYLKSKRFLRELRNL